MILPGATLGMLGGGQLGRMFAFRAHEMGYRVVVLEPDARSPAGAVADEHIVARYDDEDALKELGAERLGPAMSSLPELTEQAKAAGQILSDEVLVRLKQINEEIQHFADGFRGPVANALAGAAKWMGFFGDLSRANLGFWKEFLKSHLGGSTLKESFAAGKAAADRLMMNECGRARDEKKVAWCCVLALVPAPSTAADDDDDDEDNKKAEAVKKELAALQGRWECRGRRS